MVSIAAIVSDLSIPYPQQEQGLLHDQLNDSCEVDYLVVYLVTLPLVYFLQ